MKTASTIHIGKDVYRILRERAGKESIANYFRRQFGLPLQKRGPRKKVKG